MTVFGDILSQNSVLNLNTLFAPLLDALDQWSPPFIFKLKKFFVWLSEGQKILFFLIEVAANNGTSMVVVQAVFSIFSFQCL